MISLPTAFARAVGQLADPAIVRVLVKSVALTLLVFAALGVGLWAALEQALESYTTGFSAEIAALVSILLAVIGGWLLFRIVAIAVIQFFADEIVMAVEKRHYPGAHAVARDLTFAESLRESLKGLGRALGANLLALPVALILLVTGIGTVLLFLAGQCLAARARIAGYRLVATSRTPGRRTAAHGSDAVSAWRHCRGLVRRPFPQPAGTGNRRRCRNASRP